MISTRSPPSRLGGDERAALSTSLLDRRLRRARRRRAAATARARVSTARVPSAVTRWRNASRTSRCSSAVIVAERRLGVLRERAADAAERVVGALRVSCCEVAIAQLPQLRRGERQQRERAGLIGDRRATISRRQRRRRRTRSPRGAPARRGCAADRRGDGVAEQLEPLRQARRAAAGTLSARIRKSSRSVSTTRTGSSAARAARDQRSAKRARSSASRARA